MEDLLPLLLRAKEQPRFSAKVVIGMILQHFGDMFIQWDEGDENWANCFLQGDLVAVIGAVVPVAFVRDDHVKVFRRIWGDAVGSMQVISIADFAAPTWRLDLKAFAEMVPELQWNADPCAANPNAFSVDDLWYATIQ